MKTEKKQLLIIILGFVILFGVFASNMLYRKSISLNDMIFANGMNSQGYISSDNENTVMYGPYMSLNKGKYNLKLSYESDVDNNLRVTVFKGQKIISRCAMPAGSNTVNLKFELPFDMYDEGIEFVVDFSGGGSLKINSLVLSNGGIYIGAIAMLILYLFMTLAFVFISDFQNKEWYLVFYTLMTLLLGSLLKENILFALILNLVCGFFAFIKTNILKKRNTYIYTALILFAFGTIILCTKSSPLYLINDWVDTQSYYTMGKGIFNGKALYKDLFEQKGPVFYLIYGIGYLINIHNLYGAYFMEGVFASLTFIFAYKIANMYLSEKMSVVAVFILPVLIFNKSFMRYGGSCEEFLTALIMMSFYFFMQVFNEKGDSVKYMYLNGLLGGIVLMMKFNVSIFFGGLGLCVYIMHLINKDYKLLIQNIISTALGAFTIILPVLIWLAVSGSLTDFMEVVSFNSKYSPVSLDLTGIYKTTVNIINSWNNNWFCSFVSIGGISAFIFVKNFGKKIGGIGIALSFLLVSYGAYAYTYLSYYYMALCGFTIFGIIGLLYIFEKHGITICKNTLPAAAVMCIVLSAHYNGNFKETKPFTNYVTAQDTFALIMHTESDEPTLLNYGFLDGGFYTAADIVPNVRFFQRQNISESDYPLNMQVQRNAIQNKEIEFVVVRRKTSDGEETLSQLIDNYEMIASKQQYFEGIDFTYYLYKVK